MGRTQFFTKDHYAELCSWFHARNMPAPALEYLPTNGVIVPGVAAGFVYLTDTPVCILDCFITNPEAPSEERSAALDLITIRLEAFARAHGAKLLICTTKHESLKDRAIELGFNDLGPSFSLGKEID